MWSFQPVFIHGNWHANRVLLASMIKLHRRIQCTVYNGKKAHKILQALLKVMRPVSIPQNIRFMCAQYVFYDSTANISPTGTL